LIEYALGRPYAVSDDDLARRLVVQAQTNDLSMRVFFQTLVASPEFHR